MPHLTSSTLTNLAKKNLYIPSLDGMRAMAILSVFLAHAGLKNFVPGGFGVTVFFFISGYLITSLLRREYELNGAINLKYFYLRRSLRIFPAFYLVLFLGAGLTMLGFLDGEIKLPALLSQSFHLTNYYFIYFGDDFHVGSGIYWSLAVEEHFYLVFPLLYISLFKMKIKPKAQLRGLLGLCIFILIWRCILVYGMKVSEFRTHFASDTRIDSLLMGCCLAVYGNPVFEPHFFSDRCIKYFLLPLGLSLLLFSFLYRDIEFRETFRYTIQGVGLAPIFIAAIRFPSWNMFKVLNWRWMRFIGMLSYSLYLVHFTVIRAINFYFPHLNGILSGVSSLVASFLLSYLIYRTVELPFSRLRKNFKPT